jgi:7-cyano-7-deazaguanine synthase in queuosine biosynthesis
MRINVAVDPRRSTNHEFAKVVLTATGAASTVVDVEYSALVGLPATPAAALDFLAFGATAYAIDKLIPRSSAAEAWTREFELTFPVTDRRAWEVIAADLSACLSFLTGDRWALTFTSLRGSYARPERRRITPTLVDAPAVCLFSGGADSLVGAIDWLQENKGENLALVGHHDPNVPGPKGDQDRLLPILRARFPHRLRPLFLRVGQDPAGPDTTLRSRSLVFISLGIIVASAVGRDTPVLIPENGTICLNAPLTPSRRGSCSTRTAHPYFLKTLQSVLGRLGLEHPIQNPLAMKTKGEAFSECRNQAALREAVLESVSCAKRGHKSTWLHRNARACGRCMPCIYRRAALHAIDLDTERYGRDVCRGEVDVEDTEHDVPNDLRACLSFLRRNHTREEVESLLRASGSLGTSDLTPYADLVWRAADELRQLFRDKGTAKVKRHAGLR